MRPGIDPKVDYAFKRLFGSEGALDLLSALLHAVLRPPVGQEIVGLELLNPFNEKEGLDDKLSVVDVKARDRSGRQFNVEMQVVVPRFFPSRVLYYLARLHQSQLQEGEDYRVLRPTLSVCFANRVLFPQLPGFHHTFRLLAEGHEVAFADDLVVHLVELPRFELRAEELTGPLDLWCYFLRHGETLDSEQLPAALDVPPIHQAMEVLAVLSQNDLERERYEARRKIERDQFTLLADALDQGREEGIELGMKKGRAKGALVGRIRLSQRLLSQPPTAEADLYAQSVDQLAALAEQLERQLLPPSP